LFFLFLFLCLPLLSSPPLRPAAVSPDGIRLLAEGERGKERVTFGQLDAVSPTWAPFASASALCHAVLAEGGRVRPATVMFFLFLPSLILLPPLRDAAVSPEGIRLLAEGGPGRHAAVSPKGVRLLAEGGRGKERVAVGQLVAVSPTRVRIASA
jgi:hypothetical protein